MKQFIEKCRKFWKRQLFSIQSIEDFKFCVDIARENGVITKDSHSIILGATSIIHTKARDVMVPLSKIHYLSDKHDHDAYMQKITETNHSRFPIFTKDIEVVGILLVKEYLKHYKSEQFNLKKLIRKAQVIPESQSTIALLQKFRLHRYHMAIVVNEHGAISGLLTIEDILEEIVGEIYDETDKKSSFTKFINKNQYLVQAEIEIKSFNKFFKTQISSEVQETLGGYILELNHKSPDVGTTIAIEDIKIVVNKVSDRKIEEVMVFTKNKSTALETSS